MRTITTLDQFEDNVIGFEYAMDQSEIIQSRLSKFIAWYAIPTGDGFSFAPSKYVGYKDISLEAYEALSTDEDGIDGRESQRALDRTGWFEQVDGGPVLDRLQDGLEKLLAFHDKTASRRARFYMRSSDIARLEDDHQRKTVFNLIATIVGTFSRSEKQALRALL